MEKTLTEIFNIVRMNAESITEVIEDNGVVSIFFVGGSILHYNIKSEKF